MTLTVSERPLEARMTSSDGLVYIVIGSTQERYVIRKAAQPAAQPSVAEELQDRVEVAAR
jgi:hypothetical protein